ncbi:MAG TPA: FAD-dependent oxidoreductase, partial [Candidatus Synoicihabitans sp.]|nr:FAD-dependent oxidoreductase [Candidatus Synoicihabitans sp.]
MTRDVAALATTAFDLVVIGGGIFGACAAREAATRGLRVALIERSDFASATSSQHLKMIHGGIRYLQHGDLPRLWQSCRERSIWLRTAPHLVRPLRTVVPTYGYGRRGRLALHAGLSLYDALTIGRNRGIATPDHHIPNGRTIGADEVRRLFPNLPDKNLTGAGVFSDAQVHNPPRLVLAVIQSAVAAGAVVANYVEVVRFIREGARVEALEVRDVLTASNFEVRAETVLNAAGPYAEGILRRAANLPLRPPGIYSRDACFVVHRRIFAHDCALAVQTTTRDPDALLSRGARHLFLAPWREHTLIGVWHTVYPHDPDAVRVAEAELEHFLTDVNAAYPALALRPDDVSLWHAGLVPFGINRPGDADLRYGHRSRLIDHATIDGIHNLVTLIGVRFTTGRLEAQRAVELIFEKLQRRAPASRTADQPVFGGSVDQVSAEIARLAAETHSLFGADTIEELVTNYG